MRIIFAWAFLASLFFAAAVKAAPCAPAEVRGAAGGPIQVGSKGGGVYAFAFCRDDYSVRAMYLYAPWSALTPSVLGEIQEARASIDAFSSAFGKVAGRQCVIERDAQGVQVMIESEAWATHSELCFALGDAMRAVWPPAPVWQVAPPVAPATTRPVFRVVDGVRQTTAIYGVRATPTELCACTAATALPSGGANRRWCPTQGMSPSTVTLCQRAP